jgi:hypothetical protein
MARKTTGEATTKTKKAGTSARAGATRVLPEVGNEVRKNGKGANVVAVSLAVSLEDEIRRRAYELYLERRATAGAESGSEGQDWLIAEREIRSRHDGQEQHTA